MIEFKVLGKPSTQGSMRAFVHQGRPVVTQGGSKKRREHLADWRGLLFAAAQTAAAGELWDGPIHVECRFSLSRPAAHFGTGRNAGTVKASSPPLPHGPKSLDVDKLGRAVLDALTGSVFHDDGQVVSLVVTKAYGEPAGVLVRVQRSDA